MKIEQIETFIASVESEMFYTPEGDPHRYVSSAHEDILALEEELGTHLFLRENKNTGVLTDAGKIFLQEARQIMKDYRHMIRQMEPYRDCTDRIVIGSLPILRQYRLRRMFQRFVEEHDTPIIMEETEGKAVVEGLLNGTYDAIVCRKHMLNDHEGISSFLLATDEMAAVLWKDHPLAKETTLRLVQLKNETFFLANPYSSSFGLSWNLLKQYHISTENVTICNVDQIIPAVSEKRGVSLLPFSSLMISPQKDVVAIPLRPKTKMEVVFAVRKGAELKPEMEELIQLIQKRAKSVPQL
jgi:LysR family transcriptional activator of glutamate synthase operon